MGSIFLEFFCFTISSYCFNHVDCPLVGMEDIHENLSAG